MRTPTCSLSTSERACTICGGGFLGLFIGFFCPLCVPATAAFLSSIGLAFIPQKQVIFPLIALFELLFIYGLIKGLQKHQDISPLMFGTLGLIAVPLGRYMLGSPILTYTGAFCIIAAGIWNMVLPARRDAILPLDPDAMKKLMDVSAA